MKSKGSILIVVLWVVLVFSLMTASLAFHAGQELLMIKREISAMKVRILFMSGLNEAARRMAEDPTPHEDSKAKPWFGVLETKKSWAKGLSVWVEDEESKININYVPGTVLEIFFKELEDELGALKGSRRDYVRAILKRRYEDRFQSLEELLLLDDFKPEDLETLRPYLTVYPERPFVNPNTASALVTRALIDSLGGDHAAKKMLIARLEACRESGELLFREKDMTPHGLAELLKLPKTPNMLQVLQEWSALLTVDSQTFRVRMAYGTDASACAVMRHYTALERPQVLYWHET